MFDIAGNLFAQLQEHMLHDVSRCMQIATVDPHGIRGQWALIPIQRVQQEFFFRLPTRSFTAAAWFTFYRGPVPLKVGLLVCFVIHFHVQILHIQTREKSCLPCPYVRKTIENGWRYRILAEKVEKLELTDTEPAKPRFLRCFSASDLRY